jgi:hypothetical protein
LVFVEQDTSARSGLRNLKKCRDFTAVENV